MNSTSFFKNSCVVAAVFLLALTAAIGWAQEYSWQKPHAKVLETGDLEWAPQPFAFQAGQEVRYIDFETGDDRNPGTRAQPWKHHPWDPAAAGNAKDAQGVDTYVFKRGVTYRGVLRGDESGKEGRPIRLTSDPDWGSGEAVLAGSVAFHDGWKRAEATSVPEGLDPENVWVRQVPEGPRPWILWMIQGEKVRRLTLARTPNWDENADPEDIKSQWYVWGNEKGIKNYKGKQFNYGTDPENLDYPAGSLEGAYIYTEWGPVMGTPVARQIKHYDQEEKTVYFTGFWGGGANNMFGPMRYYVENSPHFLDEAGEWYLAEEGKHKGKIFLRLGKNEDPNRMHIEAAREGTLIDLASGTKHVHISGLGFRYTNVGALHLRPFTPEINVASIRMRGSGDDLQVTHCTFHHVANGIHFKAAGDRDRLDLVVISDNDFAHTDHGAIHVADGSRWAIKNPPKGVLGDVKILRNRMRRIGFRPPRGEHGHALQVNFPETAEIAGNFLHRGYGAGLFIFGGKPSGYLGDAPMCRILIHHNKVVDPLLNTNDWGGIETWQGGSYYVFNNISGNPGGYWNFAKRRFGFAYYLDGSFKNYHFNNIAWGISSRKGPHGNTSAFQEIHSFQNTFFNNSVYRFVVGTRRQNPAAGRDIFAGNIWEDIGDWVFWHASPARSVAEANQAHVGEVSEDFAYATNGYVKNIFVGDPQNFGVFESNGMPHKTLESFRTALRKRSALAWEVGTPAAAGPYMNAEAKDFRLKKESPAVDHGVKMFVPWSLYAVVGEWNFRQNRSDPTTLIDDSWYMRPYYGSRTTYEFMPHTPLKGKNIQTDDYVRGMLEDWTSGALRLDGQEQYLVATHESMTSDVTYGKGNSRTTLSGSKRIHLDMGTNNFLIELVARFLPDQGQAGLVRKMGDKGGYELTLTEQGGLRLALQSGSSRDEAVAPAQLTDGRYHHVIVEVDRKRWMVSFYVDGKKIGSSGLQNLQPNASLENSGDFVVGRSSDSRHLQAELDFLRVSRGSLADANTTIQELYAWQFNGPQMRDFTGREPEGKRDAGALEAR